MGRVDKGVNCSVSGCSNSAERSISGSKASMTSDLQVHTSKKGCIYVDNTIRNGKKRQKKIEKTREPDGANIIVKQYNNNYKLTSIPIISIQLNILSRNYP